MRLVHAVLRSRGSGKFAGEPIERCLAALEGVREIFPYLLSKVLALFVE